MTLDDARAEEIVHLHGADQRAGGIDDEQRRDLRWRLHQHDAIGGEAFGVDRARRASSSGRRRAPIRIAGPAQARRRSPSVKMPATVSSFVDDARHAHALGGSSRRSLRRASPYPRRAARRCPVRMTSRDARQQPAAERAARMRAREVLDRKPARIEQRPAQARRRAPVRPSCWRSARARADTLRHRRPHRDGRAPTARASSARCRSRRSAWRPGASDAASASSARRFRRSSRA